MKNKKGFTLVELLAVILLVGILLLIAVPTIVKYLNRGKNSYYSSIEEEMKVAGVEYMETYRTLLPRNIGHVKTVTLEELEANKYIDEVKDEKGNTCTGKVTVKKVKTDKYEYYSCLKCGEYYESEEGDCGYSELNNEYEDSGDYRVVLDQTYYEVEQGSTFVLPLGKVYYKEELINDSLEGQPSEIDTNTLGTQEVIYYYHGAKEKLTVKIIDTLKPIMPEVALRKENKNGKSYDGNWYSGKIYVEYKSTDYVSKGILGSGIKEYQVSEDGVNFTKITGNSEILTKQGNYLRYVRAVDNEGNVSDVRSYRIKIDITPPTCTWSGESTTWTTSARTITATCHDSISDCTAATKSKSWYYPATTKTRTLSYSMIDLAGNTAVCGKTASIYVDNTAPTISASGPTKHIVTVTATDGEGSGVKFMQYQIYLNNVLQSSNNEYKSTRFTVELNKSGTWTIKARALDNIGYWSDNGNWKTFTYSVDLCQTSQGMYYSASNGHWGDCSADCDGGTQYYIENRLYYDYAGNRCAAQDQIDFNTGQTQACNTDACHSDDDDDDDDDGYYPVTPDSDVTKDWDEEDWYDFYTSSSTCYCNHDDSNDCTC